MIRSMTGFGSAERACGGWQIYVEARSVNHKDLRVSFRTPDALRSREMEFQKLIENHVSRGHVYFTVACEPRTEEAGQIIDGKQVGRYVRALREVAERENVPFSIDFGTLLQLPDAIRSTASETELQEQMWPDIQATAREALQDLVRMRCSEGENLRRQLSEICDNVERLVAGIEERQPVFVEEYRDRLRDRISSLLEGVEVRVDEGTLAREVAHYADRSDVSEEIARLRSHLKQFRETIGGDGEPVGRKMEFIGQEMHREANTIGSKNPSEDQVPHVLELKTQVDRLREQVRNVE